MSSPYYYIVKEESQSPPRQKRHASASPLLESPLQKKQRFHSASPLFESPNNSPYRSFPTPSRTPAPTPSSRQELEDPPEPKEVVQISNVQALLAETLTTTVYSLNTPGGTGDVLKVMNMDGALEKKIGWYLYNVEQTHHQLWRKRECLPQTFERLTCQFTSSQEHATRIGLKVERLFPLFCAQDGTFLKDDNLLRRWTFTETAQRAMDNGTIIVNLFDGIKELDKNKYWEVNDNDGVMEFNKMKFNKTHPSEDLNEVLIEQFFLKTLWLPCDEYNQEQQIVATDLNATQFMLYKNKPCQSSKKSRYTLKLADFIIPWHPDATASCYTRINDKNNDDTGRIDIGYFKADGNFILGGLTVSAICKCLFAFVWVGAVTESKAQHIYTEYYKRIKAVDEMTEDVRRQNENSLLVLPLFYKKKDEDEYGDGDEDDDDDDYLYKYQ